MTGKVVKNGTKAGKSSIVKEKSDLYHLKLTFFISLLSCPIVYIFNNAFTSIDESVS